MDRSMDSLSLIGPWMPDINSVPNDLSLTHAPYFVPMPYSSLNRHRTCSLSSLEAFKLKVTEILSVQNSIS